jgi:hypothetical protein
MDAIYQSFVLTLYLVMGFFLVMIVLIIIIALKAKSAGVPITHLSPIKSTNCLGPLLHLLPTGTASLPLQFRLQRLLWHINQSSTLTSETLSAIQSHVFTGNYLLHAPTWILGCYRSFPPENREQFTCLDKITKIINDFPNESTTLINNSAENMTFARIIGVNMRA